MRKSIFYKDVKVSSPIFSVRQHTILGRIVCALFLLLIPPLHIAYGAFQFMKENTLPDIIYCWNCIVYGNDRKIKIKKP